MSPEDRFASAMFDGAEPEHEDELESAFAELAATNKALCECQIERDALRAELQRLRGESEATK